MTGLLLAGPRFDWINLSAIASPAALEAWSFDAIFAARKQSFVQYWAAEVAKNPALATYNVDRLFSNPLAWSQLVDTLREGLVRQRVNDAVLATMLLFAVKADLDARAAEYRTYRAPGESDDSLRLRAMLAWENLSIGGSYGGYEYQARSAAPADILDVAVYGHEVAGVAEGEVRVVVLAQGALGVTSPQLLRTVRAQWPRWMRKVNDNINVVAATIVPYHIDATLVIPHGVDPATVTTAQQTAGAAYASARKIIGGSVTLGGIMGAIGHADPNVLINVEMRAPFSGAIDPAAAPIIGGGPFDVPVCTAFRLNYRVAS